MPRARGEYVLQQFVRKNKKDDKHHTVAKYVKMRMGNSGEDVFRFNL